MEQHKPLESGGWKALVNNMKKILQKYTPKMPSEKLSEKEFVRHKISCAMHLALWIMAIVWLFINNSSFRDLAVYEYFIMIAIYIFKPDSSYFRDIVTSYDKYLKKSIESDSIDSDK